MGLLPQMSKIIEYVNGGTIYLSSIHPIVFQTRELQHNKIDVVISLLEEKEKPPIFKEIEDLKIRHYYYACTPSTDLIRLAKTTYNTIYKTIDYGRNVLIHCRTGETYCVFVLIVFFLKVLHTDPQYLIYNIIFPIPKTRTNWTDSFVDFIRQYHPNANLSRNDLEKIYQYETQLDYPLMGFKPLTLWSSE
jgi:hypothetical protein